MRQGKGAASGGQEGDEVPPRAANGQLEPLSSSTEYIIHTQKTPHRKQKTCILHPYSTKYTKRKETNDCMHTELGLDLNQVQ